MGEPVSSFWHGSPLGIAQQLTVKSFLDHGHPFRLWVYDLDMIVPEGTILANAREVYDEAEVFQLIGGFHDGSYAFFADQFLMKLLPQYGGWWVGMDATCLRPLPEHIEYLFGPHWVAGMGTHVLRVPSGDTVLQDALKEYRSVFEVDDYDYLAGLKLIYKCICEHNLCEAVGTAEQWGDDPEPCDLHYREDAEWPSSERILYHWCHSVTKEYERAPRPGSFYHHLLVKHGLYA